VLYDCVPVWLEEREDNTIDNSEEYLYIITQFYINTLYQLSMG